ncbi:hypothetical protein HMPREF3188_01519 [Tissierellia bacterium KA00581]|jgi:hypothetical protein|nr:hypothetical protein HMPREF3188_01519 [Tissierellia bacterium KA00581]
MNKNNFENGSVKISNDIFYMITAIATMEVEGVCSIVGVNKDVEKITSKNCKKGININFLDKSVEISINVTLKYGEKLNELVKKIQENVKLKIEVMTGINVSSVNVIIESIEM